MVAPTWGSFQKPNQQLIDSEENEFQQEIPGEIKDQEKPEAEKPQWGNFQSPQNYQGPIDPTADEGMFEYLTRNFVANASRVVEQVAGRYGNIEKFAKDTLTNVPQTGGIIGWAISELVGPEKWETMVRGMPGQQQLAPTSKQFKEASERITGGYTSPKTKGESKFQEFTEDVGAAINPSRVPTVRNFALNNLLTPAASNVVKQTVNELGFGEDKANLAKMAVWLPLSLAFNVNGPQYASELMNRGRNGFPNNLQANVPRLQQRLDTAANSHLLLHSDPRSALARQALAGVERDIANGQTNVRSLLTMYDGVNAASRNRGLFELGSRGDQAFARRAINEVRNVLRDEIRDVAANHPQALNDWRNGIQAWATIHQSNAITNWVKETAKGPYAKLLTGPAAALFGIGSYGASSHPGIALATSATTASAYKTGQVLYRMWNSPVLSDYYWRAISAAQSENLPAFINNYNKLNDKLEKSGSSKPKSKSKK